MKTKFYVIATALAIGLSAYNMRTLFQNGKSINLSKLTIEALAGETSTGETGTGETNPGGVDYSKGYLNADAECKIKNYFKCTIDITIPEWVPEFGGTRCYTEWDIPIGTKTGTKNYCLYTGGPSGCTFHECKENGK